MSTEQQPAEKPQQVNPQPEPPMEPAMPESAAPHQAPPEHPVSPEMFVTQANSSQPQAEPEVTYTTAPEMPAQPSDGQNVAQSLENYGHQAQAAVANVQKNLAENQEVQKVVKTAKSNIKFIIIGVVLLAVALGVWLFISSRPVDLTSKVEPTFKGYDTQGTLEWNQKIFESELKKAVYDKYPQKSPENIAKAKLILETVEYSFDKTTELKNDEEVTFTITSNVKDSPIKTASKTFKVTGLKPVKTISSDEILESAHVTVSGLSGAGALQYDTKILEAPKDLKPLKNDDVVTFRVSQSYIDSLIKDGKAPEANSIDYTVSGLANISDITNKDKLFEMLKAKLDERYADDKETRYYHTKYEKTLVGNFYATAGTGQTHGYNHGEPGTLVVGSLYKVVANHYDKEELERAETSYVLVTCYNLKISGTDFLLANNGFNLTNIQAQDDTNATRLVETENFTAFPE